MASLSRLGRNIVCAGLLFVLGCASSSDRESSGPADRPFVRAEGIHWNVPTSVGLLRVEARNAVSDDELKSWRLSDVRLRAESRNVLRLRADIADWDPEETRMILSGKVAAEHDGMRFFTEEIAVDLKRDFWKTDRKFEMERNGMTIRGRQAEGRIAGPSVRIRNVEAVLSASHLEAARE